MQTNLRYTIKLAVMLLMVAALFGTANVAFAALPESPCVSSGGVATCEIYATTGTALLDGSTTVNIWGYSINAGPATLPGPILIVNQGDTVTVTLHNDLAETTSLLFQGQDMIPDTTGIPPGGTGSYVFTADAPGTFLYEAGLISNGQHQVAMGMYGALVVVPADGTAYGKAFNDENVLVLSEIDTTLNTVLPAGPNPDPASFDMRDYAPKYFLINGKAYPGTDPLTGNPGENILMRYVNAGLQAHAMSTLGLSQTIIAQDGQPYTYSHNVIAETIATGQTLDTIITIPNSSQAGNQFTLYDANMLLHNSNTAGFGGMMAFLTVGNGTPPEVDPGPIVSGLSLSPNPTNGSVDVTVNATVIDSGSNASFIHAAEFYVDGTANPANAMTGAFDTATSIPVNGTISMATLGALPSGNHTIFVRGQDANLNWGPFVSVVLNLDKTGPATTGLSLTPNPSSGAEPVDLTATGNDTATGGSYVTAAEYWVDGADPGEGSATPMAIVAGADAPVRDFTATILAGLSIGAHTVSIRSMDSFGNWGAVATITLQVADTEAPTTSNVNASPNPTNGLVGYNTSVLAVRVFADFSDVATGGSNIVAAEGFIDNVGSIGSGFVFIASDGSFNSPTESGYADIPLASVRALSDGNHTIFVRAKDSSGNWGDATAATTTLVVDKTGPSFGPVSISQSSASRDNSNNAQIHITVSGSITSLTDLNFSSGTYTITDSKSNNVVNGQYAIDQTYGTFSISADISLRNTGNTPRIYTFTIYAADNLGNVSSTTIQFTVQ